MKKILLTGSLGFIGSNLIRKAIFDKYPYKWVLVDKATDSTLLSNRYFNKSLSNDYLADITDQHIMDRIFQIEKPNYVIHMAAESAVDASIANPNIFINSNVLGTQTIINCALKHKAEKLIYISSDEVLGSLNSESDSSWTEESVPNPRNPYAASKMCGELLVKAAGTTHGLNYNITRSSNNYGPRQTPNKLIPKIIQSIIRNEKIPIYGQGFQIRDWTYVDDNCAGLLTVLEKGAPNEIYNISANQECTNLEIVQKICNLMNRGHNLITHIDDPRPGHDFRYSINCNKIKQLGWTPTIKLSEGLAKTVNWYELNQWFLR